MSYCESVLIGRCESNYHNRRDMTVSIRYQTRPGAIGTIVEIPFDLLFFSTHARNHTCGKRARSLSRD